MVRFLVVSFLAFVWATLHNMFMASPMPFIVYLGVVILLYGLIERFEVETTNTNKENEE